MRRFSLLAITLLCVSACNRDRDPKKNGGGQAAPAAKPAPESPTTGISQIQKMHDDLMEDIAEQEKQVEAGRPAEQRLVRGQLTGIDILIRSTEMAIVLDTRRTVQLEHGLLRQKESKLIRARNETYGEIAEMEKLLDDFKKDAGSLPAGFTEAELKDRLGDFRKKAQEIENDREEVRRAMRQKEDLLKLDVIPPQGETLFTKELKELQLTRKRVEALQD